jgi:hypothetical protein
MKYDIGCGANKRTGFVGVDRCRLAGVDIVADLASFPWPIESDTAEEIILDNVIEHIPDTVAVFNELWRVAKPACKVEISYPYWNSMTAYGDPTHVHFFNEYLAEYFLRPGTAVREENRYSFYTDRYWQLVSRDYVIHPKLKWLSNGWVRKIDRIFGNVIWGVRIVMSPEKSPGQAG